MMFKQQKKWIIAGVLLVFVLIKIATIFWQQQNEQRTKVSTMNECQVITQGCSFLGNALFRLHGVHDDKTPFTIEATHVPDSVHSISVSFQMKNMDMGFNRIDLVNQGNGTWRASNVFLPFCTASRDDWLVQWKVVNDTDSTYFEAAFHTQKQPEK